MNAKTLSSLAALALFAAPVSAHFEDGQLYVIDFANDKIFLVDAGGTWSVSELPAANWPLDKPGAIEFTYHADMLIANFATNTILEFESDASSTTALTAADGISGPYGGRSIAIGPGHGDVYVANLTSGEILKFDEDYVSQGVFADSSDGLSEPAAIAFLADGNMWVADRGTKQLFHFEEATGVGTVIDSFIGKPLDIAIRDNGDAYVLDERGTIYFYPDGVVGSRTSLGVYPNGNGAIVFSTDQSVLYHTNPKDSAIRSIDPLTGVDTIMAVIPGAPTGLAVPGTQYAPGSFIEFGDPLPGTGGIDPVVEGTGEPRIGQFTDVQLHNFLGGSNVIVFVSLSAWDLQFLGGSFHPNIIDPAFWVTFPADGVPGVAGDGDVDLSFLMPDIPFLVGTKWYIQALGIDAGAVQGVSFSNCLTMYIGS